MTPEEVLAIERVSGLHELGLEDFADRRMTEEEFRHIFTLCDAFWQHSGDPSPSQPHALLTSGVHSDGFVDTLRVLSYPNLCEIFAQQLAMRLGWDDALIETGLRPSDWVVGSDHAAAVFSQNVARFLGVRHDFTEKSTSSSGTKLQVWKRFEIQPDERVLQVEELVTTTSTLQRVRWGIEDGNPNPVTFMPLVATLVHRSPAYEFGGSPIVYFVHLDISNWEEHECPLCLEGSEAIRPKVADNWARLHGG